MLPRKNVLDFNARKCHSLRFRVFRTGYWPGFKVKAWKIYFHLLKVIHFSKVWPFYVKRWKPVWIRAWINSLPHSCHGDKRPPHSFKNAFVERVIELPVIGVALLKLKRRTVFKWVSKSHYHSKYFDQPQHLKSKHRDEPIIIPSKYLKLAQSAGKIARTRSRCDWFWFCLSPIEKLAWDF